MSQKAFINKDIYVGNTGKQLKDIETNGDLIALYGDTLDSINSDLQTFYTTGTAQPVNTTNEITLLNRTINKGIYLFVCNLYTNNWGSSGRDFVTALRLNGEEIMSGNQVLTSGCYSNVRPMTSIINVTNDNSTLTMVSKSSSTASYAVTTSKCYLLKLKSSDNPESSMITSEKIDYLISLLENAPTTGVQLKPYILYDDSATSANQRGSLGNVTLSDDWDKYQYIEIFCRRAEYEINSAKAPTNMVNATGDLPIQITCCYYGYGTGFWIGWKQWVCDHSNKRLMKNAAHGNWRTTNGSNVGTDTEETIRCLQVIGWK